jgi:quercetin dioxygenase-like cupin family protein
MNRRTALESCLAGFALAFQARAARAQDSRQGIFVPKGQSRLPGVRVDLPGLLLLSAKDTNGALSIFGGAPQGPAPLHFHSQQDEWWYVFEGEIRSTTRNRATVFSDHGAFRTVP